MKIPPKTTVPTDRLGRYVWKRASGFKEFIRQAPDLTNRQLLEAIHAKWGVTPTVAALDALRKRYDARMTPETRRKVYVERDERNPIGADKTIVPSFLRDLGPQDEGYFVNVEGDAFVTSDWHIPHHKASLVDRLCQMAEAWRVPTLIINGDFLNQDAFSKWKHHRFNVPWQEEKGLARETLQRLFNGFTTIVYVLDNHDRRIIAANEHPTEFTESDVIELLTFGVRTKKLRPSIDYHYVVVNGRWRVTSPKEYRRMKLSLPNRLAQLYHQNIICGGDHLFGLGLDDSDRYVIANSMCMVDPARTPYIQVQDSTYPHWNPGFYLIRGDRLLAFPDHPALTDWDEAVRIGRLLHRK